MKDIQQLIKKNSQEGRYEDIFPKTFIDAVLDKESGVTLTDILAMFNMLFLSYNGSRSQTRLQVPSSLRREGLWVTYVLYDKTVVTEWYSAEAIDDTTFGDSANWRDGSNALVGDISISSDGYWVINGEVTNIKAQGETGITPILRVGSNNHLQVSYTNGGTYVDVSPNPVFTQFRVGNNKLQQSTDLGESWSNISEELAYKFRESGNKIQMSKDLGNTWEDVSDYIAAWFRFTGTTGSSQADNVGKIQISRDNGATWSDLSGEFTNSLHIKGYVATVGALPSTAVQGDIYGVGPTYDPSDTEHTNPIYQLYVKDSTGWINNGRFTSIAAGVVQEIGNSETAVMSQDAVCNTTGLNEYPLFNESKDYNIGDIVVKNGKSYKFTTFHKKGTWSIDEVVETSLKGDIDSRLNDLKANVLDISLVTSSNDDIINQTLDLQTKLEIIQPYSTIKGYIDSNGNTGDPNSVFVIQKYNVGDIGAVGLSISDMNAPVAYKYAFYSSDDISKSTLIAIGPTSPGYFTEQIKVPLNAKCLAVTNRTTSSVIGYVAKVNFNSKGIDSLLFYKEAFNTNDLQEGFWEVSENKVVVTSHEARLNYKCTKIQVPKSREALLTTNPYGSIVYGVIYTDKNDVYISREFAGNNKNEIYNRVLLTIPKTAEYMYISGYIKDQVEGSLDPSIMVYAKDYNAATNENLSGYINNGLSWNRIEGGDSYDSYFANNAIKFIAFVPSEAYKDHEFTINALSCYTSTGATSFGATQFDLWLFDKTDMVSSGSQKNAVRYINKDISNFNYNYCDVINFTGERGTLYAIVDWNIIRGYYNINLNKWFPVYWSTTFSDKPTVQKLEKDDPRLAGFINKIPTGGTDFSKLNFGVDGDSITAGNQWSSLVAEKLGFATHHNVAVWSATWACKKQILNGVTYETQEYNDPDFAGISSGWQSTTDPVEIQKRCNNCAKVHVQKFIAEVENGTYPAPDVFAFSMGTNDSDKTSASDAISTGINYPSGNMLFTLPGAMKWCIQKIHDTYPKCKIYVLYPIQRFTNGNADNLAKIKIMEDIAKAFSVEVIDMYSNCGISSMLETGTGPYLSDGLHPNDAGREKMAEYAGSCIRNYLKVN